MRLYKFKDFVKEGKNYELMYPRNQKTLFDLNLTEEDYTRLKGKYGKPLNFLLSKYKDVSNHDYWYENESETIMNSLKIEFPDYNNEEIDEIMNDYEELMASKWEEEEKRAENRVYNIRDLVINFGKEHNFNTRFIPHGKKVGDYIGKFEDENLDTLFHYLVYGEDLSIYNIQDVMSATGLDEHEIKIMEIENK